MARRIVTLCCALILIPQAALADAGIPTLLFFGLGYAWLFLVPVIVVEALCATRILQLRYGAALPVVAWANVVSTVIGIPAGYLISVASLAALPATRALFERYPYLLGVYEGLEMSSVLGVAFAMAPLFYLASVIIEAKVVRARLRRSGGPVELAWKWSWWANAASYVPICVWLASQTFG